MKTSLDYKKIFKLVVLYLTKYRVAITVVVLVAIFAFALVRINQLSDPQPNDDLLAEMIKEYKRVNVDQATVDNIQDLVESEVEVNPQFNNRDNPFSE